jgi:tripartite-type tricarboxylate transporter receptor subunit TctC
MSGKRNTPLWRRVASLTSLLLVALAGILPLAATAQSGSTPALKLVVPVTAGGNMDAATRFVGQRLALRLGRAVLIENKPGAQQVMGTEYVVRSAPDGNTLLVVGAAVLSNPSLYKLSYQALTDLTPVSGLIQTRFALVVRKDLPVRSLDEFLALLKSQKTPLSCAAAPGPALLACEQLRKMTRDDLVVVPFNGAAPAATAVLGGHVDLAFVTTDMVLAQQDSGRWQALAMGDALPVRAPLPALPSLSGRLPGFEVTGMFGFMAPAKTPPAQIAQLSKAIHEVLAEADVEAHFTRQGDALWRLGADDFGRYLRSETERVGALIKSAGIKAP